MSTSASYEKQNLVFTSILAEFKPYRTTVEVYEEKMLANIHYETISKFKKSLSEIFHGIRKHWPE